MQSSHDTVPDNKQVLAEIKEQIHKVESLPIDKLQERLKYLKDIKKRITDRKEEITKPMRAALDSARALFKPLESAIELADIELRGFILIAERKREKEQAKIAAKVESGEATIEEGLEIMSSQTSGLFRMVKKMVIKNKKVVPKKYWIIDEVLLRADVMAGKKVPGVILLEEKTVVSR